MNESAGKQPERQSYSSAKSVLEILAPIIPGVMWGAIAVVAICVFYAPIVAFLTKATSVRFGDVEVRIDASVRSFPPQLRPDSASPEVRRLARRWRQIPQRQQPYQVLIAHDVLNEAQYLQAALIELGFVADIGLCPPEIEEMLRRHVYDVVLSDVDWSYCPGKEEHSGIPFLARLSRQGLSRPTVFFVQDYQPDLGTPAFAVGITDDWYVTLNYIVDVLSRIEPQES